MAAEVPQAALPGVGRLLQRYAADLAVEAAHLVLLTDGSTSTRTIDNRGQVGPVPGGVEPFVDRAIERSGLLLIDDLSTDSVESVRSSDVQTGSLLCIGVTGELGALLGVLIARGHQPRSWTNHDIERAGDVAAGLSAFLIVDQARRHAENRVHEEVRARELRLHMHSIASQAAHASSIAEIAGVLVAESPALLGCEWAVVGEQLSDGMWEVHLPEDGLRPELQRLFQGEASPGWQLLLHAVALSEDRNRITSADMAEFAAIQDAFPDVGLESVTAVPLTRTPDGPAIVMLCGFAAGQLGARTSFVFDELVTDAQRAVERTAAAQRQIQAAATLQRSLLPPRIPDLAGVVVRRLYSTAADHSRVGGDWYDIVQLDGNLIGFVVGDVAGHDIRSAALMGQLRHVLASQLRDRRSPAGALSATDRYFADLDENVMATAVVIVLDHDRDTMRLALAGHPPPVRLSATSAELVDVAAGPPIGFGFGGYVDAEFELVADDVLIAYTDGVVETRVGNMRNLLDDFVVGLAQVGTDPDDVIEHLRRRSEVGELVDDVAALVVKRR